MSSVPFQAKTLYSVEEANKKMEHGDYSMVGVIPRNFAVGLKSGQAKLTCYINQGTSQVASTAAEKSR
ncbi:hypothetical protein ACM1RC_19090 [Paenibacillus azoreducens]|uniref:hypothetical protein n=1 Tax=Paenibacillus azoreducens TaxID=116718 RepID=UPI0039F49D4E